jgi:hypothetical protein
MNTVWAVAEQVGADDAADWESPAGPVDEGAQPRPGVPDFFFMGPGDRHWIGQRCHVLGPPPSDPSAQLVRLSCGCSAQVPRASLQSN